jgi:predicted nucleic-acid-binding protein
VAAADTNLLVRLLIADEQLQAARAAKVLREEGPLFVPQIALVEMVWVLTHTYEVDKHAIVSAIGQLLDDAKFVIQREEEVTAALELFVKSRAGFADCLLLENARSEDQLPLLTFDKALAKLPGARAI